MNLLQLEVTSATLLATSLFFWALAAKSGNAEDAVRARKAAIFFAAVCLALAFPLSLLGWKDLCLVAGLALYADAVHYRSDTGLMIVYSGLGAVALVLWVLLYQMSLHQYEAGFGLAVADSLLLAAFLLMNRPKRDPAPAKSAALTAS